MKNEQEKLEDFLKSELKKEGDEILAEIEADESLRDIALPDDFDDGLWEKIRQKEAEKAAYEALSEKDKEALRLGREMQLLQVDEYAEDRYVDEEKDSGNPGKIVEAETIDEKKEDGGKVVRYRKRKKRIYLLVAAVAVLVLAAGMTSIGGAPFVTGMMKKIVGDREMVQIDSEREGEDNRLSTESEEAKFYQSIEEEFGFAPIRLRSLPANSTVIDWEINNELEEACMLLECGDKIIEYQIWVNFSDKSIGYDVEDELIEKSILVVSGIEVEVSCYKIEESNLKEYVAQFENDNVYYIINGSIEGEEFVEIIKNLKI